jgi:nicotinamidase/pyrazinamidase
VSNHHQETTPLEFTPSTALIVVDVQNDFADPDGSLYVGGGDQIVGPVNELVAATLEAGGSVFYTQDWHPPTTPHFVDEGGVWPVHCVRDTWGAQLHPDLVVEGPVVRKGTNGEDGYSGFTMRDPVTGEEAPTSLQTMLDEAGVDTTIVVGLALDVCVKATAADAVANGHQVAVVADAVAAVELTEGDGDRAIDDLMALGVRIV